MINQEKMISRILPNGNVEIDMSMENISIGKKIDIIKKMLKGEVVIENGNKSTHDKKKFY